MAKGLSFTLKTDVKKLSKDMQREFQKAAEEYITEVGMDFTRVSSGLTPYKTGKLQDSYTHTFTNDGKRFVSTTKFKAINRGFDYARWTHNATYNLGPGSLTKVPARSKFATVSRGVGPGYAEGLLEDVKDGYHNHLQKLIAEVCRKYKK